MPSLLSPITSLHGIGPALSKKFLQLGIQTLQDALFYFPFRHEDWRHVTTIDQVAAGMEATLLVKIESILSRRAWRKHTGMTEARVTDSSGAFLQVVWFNQPYLSKTLKADDHIYLSGTVTLNRERIQMTNPAFERPSNDPAYQKLVPVYRSTEGLSQRQLRSIIKQAVELVAFLPDPLPKPVLKKFRLDDRPSALANIHFPPTKAEAKKAVDRLKFDELLSWHLEWQNMLAARTAAVAPALLFHEQAVQTFVQSLPFDLTKSQRIATWEILRDIGQAQPMYRLLQGDVGSGKTVVAAIVAMNIVQQGYQVVVLAPTLILAEQHFQTFTKLFTGREVTIALLTSDDITVNTMAGSLQRLNFLDALRRGEISMVIATHAALQEYVVFHQLGLVVVDEQQRFGVEQRQQLLTRPQVNTDYAPHFLSMTATPIPRTVALFMTGTLSLSRLTEKPADRGKISTEVVGHEDRAMIDQAISTTVARQEQVYVVTPLIEESDFLGVRAATVEHRRLQKQFPETRIGLVHGSLPPDQRVEVLDEFRDGQLDVLVSTTVIEVGVDVPNATLMVIEGSERFGLAQLYQLRGRVGRGTADARCILATDSVNPDIHLRLQKVATFENGMDVAEFDLQERGSGTLYGLRQSGLPDWKLASLQDVALMATVAKAAKEVLAVNPQFDPAELSFTQELPVVVHQE